MAELQPALNAIDLAVDLNEDDTGNLMVALRISAYSGDPQLIGDRWIKLGVLVEREVITSEQWLELCPAVMWRDREEGVKVVPDRPLSTYRALSDQELRQRALKRRSGTPLPPNH